MRLLLFMCVLLCAALAQELISGQCAVIGTENVCERRRCTRTEINSTCGGLVVGASTCDDTYFASFDVLFGGVPLKLYQSREAELVGYETLEEMREWVDSVPELVNCSVSNSTAYISNSVTEKSGGGSRNYGVIITGLASAILFCVVVVVCAVVAAVAAFFGIKLKTRKDDLV